MSFTLTQKETTLLKDLKEQEKLCTDKYRKHAECAHDPQLKQLFTDLSNVEQHHFQMLSSIESGTVPTGVNGASVTGKQFTATYTAAETPEKKADAYLCSDLLATEKHVSALYNTCVFEFERPELRKVLSQIQTDEQVHGEKLYQYMKANSMYS
ncbi:MAG: ferritin-like domain-containing protein [Ruminococcaceae bacterium]|nr:ferritin-like domain-containing protein [Oscillospiraceae bacterium]